MSTRAQFTRMQDSTAADWQTIAGEFMPFAQALPDRIVKHLQLLQGDYGGFPVDRYTHSLQTATRALRDGRDEEVLTAVFGQVEGRLVLAFGLPGCGVAGEDEGVVGFLGQVNGFSEEVFVVL